MDCLKKKERKKGHSMLVHAQGLAIQRCMPHTMQYLLLLGSQKSSQVGLNQSKKSNPCHAKIKVSTLVYLCSPIIVIG